MQLVRAQVVGEPVDLRHPHLADQRAVGVRRQRRLTRAGQTEEQRGVVVGMDAGRVWRRRAGVPLVRRVQHQLHAVEPQQQDVGQVVRHPLGRPGGADELLDEEGVAAGPFVKLLRK